MTSSASVDLTTSATVTDGAVSSSVARPSGNAITAKSVTTRSTGRAEVRGSVHRLHDLRFSLGGVLHRDDDALCARDEIHGAAHAGHHLAWDHPVRQQPGLIHLKAAKDRQVDMAAANEAERHGAVESAGAGQGGDGFTAGIGQASDAPCLFQAARRCR